MQSNEAKQSVQPGLKEIYGEWYLSQLFTHIWLGHWDQYEAIMQHIPKDMRNEFPFHPHYDRELTDMWHDNYFSIPGIYFIPPYLSSYREKTEEDWDQTRQDLLCLVSTFDQMGFYYPLEQDEFPDHIGSMTGFIAAACKQEVEMETLGGREDSVKQLRDLRHDMYVTYMEKALKRLWKVQRKKLSDPFFKAFLPFYMENIALICQK